MDGRIANDAQVAYIRKYTITSGQEEGVKVIELYNGRLRVLLNESKALDIMQIFDNGMNVSFISKNGFSLRNDDFLKRFEGGMLYTVGLDSAGNREGYPLHGSFHNKKPEVTRCEISNDEIIVEATLHDTALFGKNLVIKRRYSLKLNASEFSLQDILINQGTKEEEYCLLYHNNIGFPLLDEGCKLKFNVTQIQPRTALAKEKIAEMYNIEKPSDNVEETCYFLTITDGVASIINENKKKMFSIIYSNDVLKEFVLWKSMKAQDYALGLEPSTTKLDDDFTYNRIKPQEKISFSLVYKVTDL